jgi:SH3-like domain-containing protein
MKRAGFALALLAAGFGAPQASSETEADVTISRFSGKPVPRFEALRHETVNGRKGPDEDYAVQWEYKRKGLPVLILKESGDWRYVRDPAGDQVWIKKTQLTGAKDAQALEAFVMKAGRASDSADVATISAGVLLRLGDCDATMCQVSADNYRGWAPRSALWGVSDTKG